MDLHQQIFLKSRVLRKLQISDAACTPVRAWSDVGPQHLSTPLCLIQRWSLQISGCACTRTTTYMLKCNGHFLYTSNDLEVQACFLTHSAIWCGGNRWVTSWLSERGQEEYCEPRVSPKLPLQPAFGLPHDRLANQCKCRRQPGPQSAFQRARTTSRALNKCRCDRQETQGGPPLHPAQAGAHRRGLWLWALRAVCRGGMGCAASNRRGNGAPEFEGREWWVPRRP